MRTKTNKASNSLHLALSQIAYKSGRAVDLGCGNGVDTFWLIEKGWTVTALDFHDVALETTYKRIPPGKRHNLTLVKGKFENVDLPIVDLILANDSLAFCKPDQFPIFWNKIKQAINLDGWFAGNFFAKKGRFINKQYSLFRLDEVKELFNDFSIEIFLEKDEPGPTVSGELWHIFYVVARKIKV